MDSQFCLSLCQKSRSVREQSAEENICDLREEVIEGWMELQNYEFHTWHFLPIITKAIKISKIKWVGCVAHMRSNNRSITNISLKF
jgi:hypothetical protein